MDPTKPFDLTFDEREGYLYAKVVATEIDRATALAYLAQIADRLKRDRVDRLMLVRDIPVMLPDSDLFFTTQDFLRTIGTTCVAFVNPYAKIEKEMDFAVLIGSNRGGNYRLFKDESAAEQWLVAK